MSEGERQAYSQNNDVITGKRSNIAIKTARKYKIIYWSTTYSPNDDDVSANKSIFSTRTSNGETGSISVIVGVAVLVLVIVAIVFIKLTRMSRRAISKPQPVSPPTENFVYSKLAAKYDERSSNHSPQNNESIATSSTIVKLTDSEKESGDMLLTTNDDVYNHTWDKPMKERQPDHVYSTTCSGSEYDYSQIPGINSDVYNHTWDKPITEQQTDHVYSTTGSGNDASLYDHTE